MSIIAFHRHRYGLFFPASLAAHGLYGFHTPLQLQSQDTTNSIKSCFVIIPLILELHYH